MRLVKIVVFTTKQDINPSGVLFSLLKLFNHLKYIFLSLFKFLRLIIHIIANPNHPLVTLFLFRCTISTVSVVMEPNKVIQ